MNQPTHLGAIGFGDILDGTRPKFLQTSRQFNVAKMLYTILLNPEGGQRRDMPPEENRVRGDVTSLISCLPETVQWRCIQFLHDAMAKSHASLAEKWPEAGLSLPPAPEPPERLQPFAELNPEQVKDYERRFEAENGHFTFEQDETGDYRFAIRKHADGTVAKLRQDLHQADTFGKKAETTLGHVGASIVSSAKVWREGIREGGLAGAIGYVTGVGLGKLARWAIEGTREVPADTAAKIILLSHLEVLSGKEPVRPTRGARPSVDFSQLNRYPPELSRKSKNGHEL